MALLKVGTQVSWTNGKGIYRTGVVVAHVKKRQLPNTKKFPLSKKPAGMGRGHVSYVVQSVLRDNGDQSEGRYFWPLVKYIQAA